MIWGVFLLNIGLYSLFPLYFMIMKTSQRTAAFYSYIGIILLVGGVTGAIYSFPLSENLHVSGGNIAYGAFMMSTIMLIIIEHDVSTFRNIIRLVIMVDFFVFVGFNFLAWLFKSEHVLNPLHIPFSIFQVSLWVIIIGGILILCEILLLLFIFLQVRKRLSNLLAIAFIYTLAFILILCADGIFFPLLAFGLSPDLVSIIFGNVFGKFVMGICYSIPMFGFFLVFRKNFLIFIDTPLTMNELIRAPRKKLLETLYKYEIRDQQLQHDKQILTEMAEHDGLTSLANKRRFDQIFTAEWSRSQREKQPLTLIIGDIDFFKLYNDTYGHQQGDVCLKKVAAYWGSIFKRPTDLAARIGGEEFAIILPNTVIEESLSRLQEFLTLLHDQAISHRSSPIASHVTMSIGVAGGVPHKDSSANDLFLLADQRLYLAKNSGRNKIVSE